MLIINSGIIDLLLLIIELVLLILTFVTIALHRKEEKAREELIEKMLQTAKIVSRQEYFNLVLSSIQESSVEIAGIITGTRPVNEDRDMVARIVYELRKAKERGVMIRYILPKSTDRFEIGCLYSDAGAIIKFHPGLIVSDVRFTVIDGKTVILGLPSIKGYNNPTKEGYILPSEGLSSIFMRIFDQHWEESQDCSDYIRDVINELLKHNEHLSKEKISAQLNIPIKMLQDFDKQ